jgi:hypothetical protein
VVRTKKVCVESGIEGLVDQVGDPSLALVAAARYKGDRGCLARTDRPFARY